MIIALPNKKHLTSAVACIGRLAVALCALCSLAMAESYSTRAGTESGASAVWIFANLSFTGMRAQATGNIFWKIVTFIFGFPGTLLTLLVVSRGSERAYGVDMPRKQRIP
jgi:hypothetical protein